MGHINPKNGQGDGAGFGRLRAAQRMRSDFQHILEVAHTCGPVYVDQVREYAGAQIVFFRAVVERTEYARVAVFKLSPSGKWIKDNDIIANHADR